MKTRKRRSYTCQACDWQTAKWLGHCPDCGGWDTFVETPQVAAAEADQRLPGSGRTPLPLTEITRHEATRLLTGMREFDRALGGGIVRGSLVLIGGDPGIGKSTLLLQAAHGLSRTHNGDGPAALYVSGEESACQLRLHAERLSLQDRNIHVLTETSMALICAQAEALRPGVLIIDSIQTVFTEGSASAPGSVNQIRESTAQLMSLAKTCNLPVLIIGHVTKEGTIAGPRVMEHMVDTVLYFEGERHHVYRVLRAIKNRFGPTHEIGVFEMQAAGLSEVENPSAFFLAERPLQASGSVVVASLEGTRPLLVELQALGSRNASGNVRRVANGVDYQRLMLLLAVMEKRLGLPLNANDVYVNVVGGLSLNEPAIDLGIVAAIASSLQEATIDADLVVLGEIGLTGEIRAVGHVEARLREAAKLGFRRCLLPQANLQAASVVAGVESTGVRTVSEALEAILPPLPSVTGPTERDLRMVGSTSLHRRGGMTHGKQDA